MSLTFCINGTSFCHILNLVVKDEPMLLFPNAQSNNKKSSMKKGF